MDGTESEPATKRQRRSHHRNQLPAYCYCARCAGNIKQKPRTIDDHRTRYPVRIDTGPQERAEDLPGSIIGGPSGHIECSPTDNRSATNSPVPVSPVPPLEPQPVFDEQESTATAGTCMLGLPQSPPDHSRRRAGRLPERQRGRIPTPEDEHLGIPEEFEQEYPFNRLLDEPYNHPRQVPPLYNDMGYEGERDDEDEGNHTLYDADFGLPEEVPLPAVNLPCFQLPDDDDIEPEPEDEPEDEPDDNGAPDFMCAAFLEPDLIRNAYIDAFIQKSLYGATHRALKHQLKAARRTIAAHPDITPDDIAKMAQSISTVERRLGVDSSNIITTFTLCPICKRRYSPEYVEEADNELCLNDGCEGTLFSLRKLASGSQRKVSHLTYPYASPIAWLRHILTLPGMSELMQTWRTGEDDNDGLTQPISADQWLQNVDPNKPIGDISEGWGWRSTMAGLQRCREEETGEMVDESEFDPPVRFVSLPFGISFSLNTDWFQATKEGNYSVGACYLVINNLPRHMRFLRENIALTIVMPGPNEPDSYGLDQMLDPLIKDLLRLKQGVRMLVRRGDPPEYAETVVHSELSLHMADLIARIKMGGGAGVKSEMNFCLYCHNFEYRDPQTDMNNAYMWKSKQTLEERRALFEVTGNRFTSLHKLPGWYTATSSPIDVMHLLYLGGMNWIVKQILVGPGMLAKRRGGGQDPRDIFNDCLERMWMPRNFQQLPPKLGQTRVSIKADQWKLAARTIFIPLYLALRDGDNIAATPVPRGHRSSPGYKHQVHRAKLLHQQRRKHYNSIGQPTECPPLEQCFPSRNPQFHYRQVLRFCLATCTLDKRAVSPADTEFAQNLLQSLCADYATHNVPPSPNFHYMLHLEECILRTGSVYNTHVWAMERANGIVSRINHNGRHNGMLEGTLMRGWWGHSTLQNLIQNLQSLLNRTPADESVIQDLLMALKGGNEDAQQRGTLMAFIAQCQTEYTRLHGLQNSTKLSKQSHIFDLEAHGLYHEILQFCVGQWPNAGIFGPGVVERHYLAPVGMVRNHSYVEFNGIQYGAHTHTSGKGYCYVYIDGRQPVRIERVLHVKIANNAALECICAIVRPFRAPHAEPDFPWDTWAGHLGIGSWAYDELKQETIVPVDRFSGAFALFDVPTTDQRYWITVALDSLQPEQGQDDGGE